MPFLGAQRMSKLQNRNRTGACLLAAPPSLRKGGRVLVTHVTWLRPVCHLWRISDQHPTLKKTIRVDQFGRTAEQSHGTSGGSCGHAINQRPASPSEQSHSFDRHERLQGLVRLCG
jgi:hypothetical protein